MQVPELALDGAARCRHAMLREFRRHDACVRRPAAVEPFRPGSVGHEFEQPACLAASDPNCDAQLLGVQPEQGARRGGGAERARGAGGMEAARIRR